MAEAAVGFMSYVRFVDDHEDGRLSEFCRRLAGEVRLQTGEEFPIFQDRNDVKWGQAWQSRINGAVESATFLIPIITPGFFKSTFCRDELERFLEREQKLGRSDLILPVYYVGCPLLDDPQKRSCDPLAMLIAERQLVDWRELRFEPFTSPSVGKMLAKMAAEIMQASARDWPRSFVPESSVPARSALPSAQDGIAEQSATGEVARSNAVSKVTAKTEPPTRVVDALYRGDHTTLTEAVKSAAPGDRILVRPGIYREGVVIDKPLEIIGDGDLCQIVVEAAGSHVILFRASMGRLSNLTLRQTGGGKFYCIDIAQGRLEVQDCDISSQSLVAVAIHGGADPLLRRNRIYDSKSAGVFVYENGQGLLEDNEIFGNTSAGIAIKAGGNPTLRRNRIHDGKAGGVFVYENGQGLLEDNEIFGNTMVGIEVREGGNPTLRRNRIHDGKAGGVLVHTNGQGLLEDNEIFGNTMVGIEVREGGNPTLRRNRIHDGKSAGVVVYENGQGLLEDNEIFGNTSAGITIQEGGNPTLRRNSITKNEYEAIWILDGGRGTFEDNDLRGNKRGAWDIAQDCLPHVIRARNKE